MSESQYQTKAAILDFHHDCLRWLQMDLRGGKRISGVVKEIQLVADVPQGWKTDLRWCQMDLRGGKRISDHGK